MGQYHKIVNLDKKQVISPHEFTDGYKLLEWGQGGFTTTALAALLACSNNRGGGDLQTEHELIGSWAGDRIAVVGDYWEEDEAKAGGIPTWDTIAQEYYDISVDILKVLCEDRWIKSQLVKSVKRYDFGKDWSWLLKEAK